MFRPFAIRLDPSLLEVSSRIILFFYFLFMSLHSTVGVIRSFNRDVTVYISVLAFHNPFVPSCQCSQFSEVWILRDASIDQRVRDSTPFLFSKREQELLLSLQIIERVITRPL